MGTKYTTTSVGGYNSAPPSDDGSITVQNLGKWSDVKTKLSDPLNTAVASIDSKLTSMLDMGPVAVSTNYTVTSSDFMKTLYVTATAIISIGDAASLGAGFYFYVMPIVSTASLGRVTSGNAINGALANLNLTNGILNRVQVLPDLSGFFTNDYYQPSTLVAQRVYTQTGAYAFGTTSIPHDDTIPQSTEGDQYLTLSITPKNASNILVIEHIGMFTCSAVDSVSVALFQDSTANALATVSFTVPTANYRYPVSLRHTMTAGTIAATTFKIRAGANSASTTYFNGDSGGRKFGGGSASNLCITEYRS